MINSLRQTIRDRRIQILKVLYLFLARRGRMARPLERVLFLRRDGIGDAVIFLPSFKALEAKEPGCRIDLINFKTSDEVLMAEPEVSVIRKPFSHFLNCVSRRIQYDHIVVFSGGREIHFLRYLLKSRNISFVSNTSIQPRERFHSFYRRLIEQCFGRLSTDDAPPHLTLTGSEQKRGREILDLENKEQRPIVAVVAGSMLAWKDYPKWEAVIELMTTRPVLCSSRICILGGPPAANIASQICLRNPQAEDLTDLSLRDSMAVASLVDLVVCADSGFMHVAVALDRPVLALFGATDPTILLHDASLCGTKVLSLQLDCSPCYQPGSSFVCTNRKVNGCMQIPARDVVAGIAEILAREQRCMGDAA